MSNRLLHRRQAKVLERPRTVLSRPQWEIYRHGWTPEARFRVAVCGRRFGKSELAIEEMRRAARVAVQRNIPCENEIWYGAPHLKQARRDFWPKLRRSIPRAWMAGKPNEVDLRINLVSGHTMRVVGLDNYDALRGAGLFFFVGDEWQDVDPAAWHETIRPMLATAEGNALFTGTPKGFNHFYEDYQRGQAANGNELSEPDWRSWTYTTIQGGNVKPSEIEAAKRTKDLRTYRQEYEASFETFSGRVIFAFTRAESVREKAYDPSRPVHLGVDFNVNPMTGIALQEFDGVDYVVDEIILPTASTDDLVDEVRRRYGRGGSLAHVTAYPDPAGAQRRTSAQGRTDISILQASGMKVLAMSSHPLVRDRTNLTNARFQAADGKRNLFVSPRCLKTIEALEKHVYKDGSSDPDKSKGFDHPVDALGYCLYARYAYKPPRMATVPGLFQR